MDNGQYGENMNHDVLRQPFIKANLLNVDEAWTIMGQNKDESDTAKLYREVSYLFRAVNIRSNAVARMPFEIYRGDNVIDSSKDYQNALGFLKNPGYMFGKLEAALSIWGNAYQFRRGSSMRFEELRYLLPSTIRIEIDEDTGEPTFVRTVNGKSKDYTAKEIVYYWSPDAFVETGEACASPVMAAAAAAGVLLNVDAFATAFFERGAIKAQLFSVGGNVTEPERNKFKSFLKRLFRGSASSWASDVLNADTVTVTEIGEGLESLDNRNLTDEQREAIATAVGIPHPILFSGAASGLGGGGVARQADYDLYDKTVVPECLFIQSVMNEQVLNPLGYRLRFMWETLDVFQEDEKERAASLQFLTQTLEKGPIAGIGMDILGYEIQDETQSKLEAIWAEMKAEKDQQRADFMARIDQSRGTVETEDDPKPRVPKESDIKTTDLDKWQAYAVRRVKTGKAPDRDWDITGTEIDGATKGAVYAALQECHTVDEVESVFSDVWKGYP